MNVDLVQKALAFAVRKHGSQMRRDENIPYVIHSIRVAELVRCHWSLDQGYYIVALLHDTLEDTETTREELEAEFGERIATLVWHLTNDKEEIKRVGKTIYLRRKVDSMPMSATIIKLCDRLDNIQSVKSAPANDLWSKTYAEQTYFIFEGIEETDKTVNYPQMKNLLRLIRLTLEDKGYPCPW